MSELIRSIELSTYPTIAMVIFLVIFAGVVAWVWSGGARLERHGAIPFDNDDAASRTTENKA
ncbi:MAG: cbb3-type cytochrome c oxidase subunit 3 [Phycisphaerales bacterium]|nr:cbb3-type cytochrome c oxidase subunit 3 [Phycisphaerales bacterium]